MVKVIGAVTVLVDRMGTPQCAGPQRRAIGSPFRGEGMLVYTRSLSLRTASAH